MKTKLVLWGQDENAVKVLMAIQLRSEDNQVDVWSFHGEEATNDLHKQLLYEWREGKETAFPATGYQHHEAELTAAGAILPENITPEKQELIDRAKTEWHFVVLSSKLNTVYQSELADLEEKINAMESYRSGMWEELKTFWDKVRGQMIEDNLLRDHANSLKRQVNALFSRLKELRSSQEEEFQMASREHATKIIKDLDEVDARIKKGTSLHLVFEELKSMQRDFRNAKLTRPDRSKLWERIDGAFKTLKEKRFGATQSGNSPSDRHQHRLTGLIEAIDRMKKSIQRDKDDLRFQDSKKNSSSIGQLESQLLDAKIKMIESRMKSKEDKLDNMNKTRDQVEKQLAQAQRRQEEFEQKAKDKAARAEKAAKENKPAKDADKKQDEAKSEKAAKENKPTEDADKKQDEAKPEDKEAVAKIAAAGAVVAGVVAKSDEEE